ncbi:MaoC family dehydratase [Sphingomonas sp. ASY06-1R]|jgi:acyl dehydratase|uniref:MaoC family dehydratase n=1 Tax=Sphingomonas sp. ASY06-1R TaxID=3445771 RepID=UPI003FA2F338
MIWFEDLPVGRRDRFGSIAVTREDMLDFARKFDPQPFHLDDDAAAANPLFGRLSASGWHTAAMGMRMTADFWAAADSQNVILGGAGVDELRWLTPVYAGDRLRAEAEVVDARPSASKPDRGIVRFRTILYNQEDVPVMSHLSNVLIRRRPA